MFNVLHAFLTALKYQMGWKKIALRRPPETIGWFDLYSNGTHFVSETTYWCQSKLALSRNEIPHQPTYYGVIQNPIYYIHIDLEYP